MKTVLAKLAGVLQAIAVVAGLVFGTFDTQEVRPWDVPGLEAAKRISFPVPFNAPPLIAMGFTALDISNGTNVRIFASASNITQTSAYLHLNSWSDTRLYSTAIVWYAVPPDDPYVQTGRFATLDDHPVDKPQQNTSRRITFARPYASPPRVVVWLNELDLWSGANWRVSATASDVTPTGFTLHLDTWADSVLYQAAASWIAYPSGSNTVWSGTYGTFDVRNANPQLVTNATIDFPTGFFQRDPTVLNAINYLDVGCKANLRMITSVNPVGQTGMTWHLNSWVDSVIYGAGAEYIAFAQG